MKKFKLMALLLVSMLSINLWGAVAPASLPLDFTSCTDANDYTEARGFKKNNLGSYSSAVTCLKFDATGDYLLIQIADNPDEISFKFKQNGSSAGTFLVQESANGLDYTTALTVTWPGDQKTNTPSASLKAATRYIKLNYSLRGNSTNVALGGIKITKAAPTTPYTVEFDAGSCGTCNTTSLTEAEAGAGITLPNVTANDGWKFLGWATTSGATTADAGAAGATYKPSKDITLYAVYIQQFDVKWYVNGDLKKTDTYDKGANLHLPEDITPVSTDCDGVKVFVGWRENTLDQPTDIEPTGLFTAASGTVTAPATYHAVFALKEGEDDEYIRITQLSELKDGISVVLVNNKYSTAFTHTTTASPSLSYTTAPTESSSKITATDAMKWTLVKSNTQWLIKYGDKSVGASTLPSNSSGNKSKTISFTTSNSTWTIAASTKGTNCFYFSNGTTSALEASSSTADWVVYYSTAANMPGSDYYATKVYKSTVSYSQYSTSCVAAAVETPTITTTAEKVQELYWDQIPISMACETSGAEIYYTTDGVTEPTKSSTKYNGQFNITTTTKIKAKAFVGDAESYTATQTFTFGKTYADVAAYLTDKANIADNEKIKINYLRVTITSIANTKETVYFSGANLHVSNVTCPTNWVTNGILVAKNQIYTARVFDNGSSYQLRPSAWTVFTYVTNLPNVTGLTEENVTSSSVTLKWTAVTNAGSYQVKFNGEEKEATTATSMTISDLNYNTQYSWYVKALTADLDVATDGNYGSAKNFTTLDVPHKVTFHAGDKGTCATESLTETATGAGVTLPEVTNIATGYDFKGWSTSETPTSANAGAAGANYKPADDIDLYAYYTPQVYDISYQDEGGATYSGSNFASLPHSHTYNQETQLIDGVKTGYNFIGWFTDAACTTPISTLGATDYLEAITLFAKWEVKTTTITLSQTDATTKGKEEVVATWGQPMPEATMPQREHYQFAGYTHSNVLYYNAAGTSAKDWDKEDAEATLTAQWEINKHNIILPAVLAGGTLGVSTGTTNVSYDATVTITPYPNAHYTLTALTYQVGENTPVSIKDNPSFKMPDADVTIAATFTEDPKRTISWSVGGSIAATTNDVYDGTAFATIKANAPTVEDDAAGDCADKFMGWATEAIDGSEGIEEGNVKWATNATTSETQNTFYAVFAKKGLSQKQKQGIYYKNEGTTASDEETGISVSGNLVSTSGNGNPIPGFSQTKSANSTVVISNIDLSQVDNPKLQFDYKVGKNGTTYTTFNITPYIGSTAQSTVTQTSSTNNTWFTSSEFVLSKSVTKIQIQATGTYNSAIDNIVISGLITTTETTYSNYITQCCTPYSITLENNGTVTGGTFSITPLQACEGAVITISNTPETGYSFVKYTFTKTEGGQEIDPDDLTFVDEEFLMPNYDITIAATFTNQYTITFDNQEATTAGIESTTATYGQAMPSIAGNLPEKTNYNFGGYFDAKEGNGTQYYNADGTSAKNWDKTSAATLYAYWLPITSRTISYLGDEHLTYSEKPISVDGAEEDELTIEYTVNSGYEIKGVTVKVGETTLTNNEIDYDATMLYIRPEAGFNADVTITFNIDLIHATEITLSEISAEIMQGKSLQLTATVLPDVVLNKDVTWTSSDASGKISVNADGLVSVARDAEKDATATITATSVDNNQVYASCTITVLENANWFGLYDKAGDEMEDGEYIIYYDGNVLKNTTSDDRIANVSGITPVEHIISIDDDALAASIVWEIKKSGEYWTIYNTAVQKYAAGTGTKSEATLLDEDSEGKALWTITKTNDAKNETYNIRNKKNTDSGVNAYLRYNSQGATYWACYASGQSGPVSLYKKGYKPKAALISVALEGTLSKTEYIAGDKVSIAGLTVMGGYNDGTSAAVAFDDIQWSFEPETLTESTSSVSITATVGELTDTKSYDVNVSAIPQEHVYGYFNFTTSGADISEADWNDNTKWSTSYTEHTITADEADVIFKEANKATATITTMPVVKGGDIILKLKESNKQLTSVAMATRDWNNKEQNLSIEVSRDNTNWIKLDAAGTETTGISAAINKNDIRFVKFLFSSNSNQIGIASISFTTSDIQYDYKRTDLVVGNYGTLCVPYAVKAADRSGATFWSIETSNAPGYTNPSSVTIVEEEGDLVAGKPYIFCATETEMAMFFSGEEYKLEEHDNATVLANGLFGNLTDDDYIINENANPQPTDEPTRGYFFVLQQKLYECGWNCIVGPNRGWVHAAEIEDKTTPSPAPRRVIGNPNGTPTGIHNLNADGFKNIEGARKYFHNNNIVIVNEGRIYNAQGILIQ